MIMFNCYPCPVGTLYCVASEKAVLCISYTPLSSFLDIPIKEGMNDMLLRLNTHLDEYFSGILQKFDIPIELNGTEHQKKVWNTLQDIPYGQTVTYADIAKVVGSVPIAVGQAVGKNRINILIPCHRVVGSDGSLTGYGGGLERKKFLLDLEAGERN